MATKKKGTLETIYEKAKEVTGNMLSGAASGAVAGAALSAVEAVGIEPEKSKVAGNGKGRTTKGTAAKNADAAQKPIGKSSPKKKGVSKTNPTKPTAKIATGSAAERSPKATSSK